MHNKITWDRVYTWRGWCYFECGLYERRWYIL